MRKFILSIFLVMLIITSCSDDSIEIPDIRNLNEDDVKTVLINNQLIPEIKYEFSKFIRESEIISVTPIIGTKVNKNDKIVIIYSKGDSIIESKHATIEWYHMDDSNPDEWNFYNPYIDWNEDMLYIQLTPTLGKTIELSDKYDTGFGLATAIINDPYDKKLPVEIGYFDSKTIHKGEETKLVARIPISDLDKSKPTDFSLYIGVYINEEYEEINLNFTMTW